MTSSRWNSSSQTGSTVAGADNQVGRYAEMKDEIARIQATAKSADQAVTVVAGPSGAVLDIRLSDQALRSGSGRELGTSIMSTLRIAVADAARQQAEVVQAYVGDRLNIVDRVMSTQQELLGDKIEAGEQEKQRIAEQSGSAGDEQHGSMLRSVRDQRAPQPPVAPVKQTPPEDDDEYFENYDPFAQR